MNYKEQLARFPAYLQALIEAELAAGNSIVALDHCFPAPPAGACVRLSKRVSTQDRASKGELHFFERNSSSYSGEFCDPNRFFFIVEPPDPPPAEVDMDAIRNALNRSSEASVADDGRKSNDAVVDSEVDVGASKSQEPLEARQSQRRSTMQLSVDRTLFEETGDRLRRWLYFRDDRPPTCVQELLERKVMVVFQPSVADGQLQFNAVANYSSAEFHFRLCLEAAEVEEYCYALFVEISLDGSSEENRKSIKSTSASWFKYWTSEFLEASKTPAAVYDNALYRIQRDAVFAAERQLSSVPLIQAQILEGLKRGGRFSRSHKEGGSRISWDGKNYVRSDYGDDPGTEVYQSDAEFLDKLYMFFHWEVTIHAAANDSGDINAWRLILRSMYKE